MSALYPTPSPTATAWLATLRATLAGLGGEVPSAGPVDARTLAAQLRTEAPEAAELDGGPLEAVLQEFGPVVTGLATAFGLHAAAVVIALGRGQPLGELDPLVAQAADRVPEIKLLTSSGTVTIEKDGRATTLVAATTVGPPVGPVRVPWPDRDDVWLCAVPATGPLAAAEAALARILPHTGVLRADVRPGAPAGGRTGPRGPEGPHAAPQTLHAALLTVDPAADPDLVMARLEGWRTAVEQLHRGAVAIHWEQA